MSIIICEKCGEEYSDVNKECVNCGYLSKIGEHEKTKVCMNCGMKYMIKDKFCHFCGSPNQDINIQSINTNKSHKDKNCYTNSNAIIKKSFLVLMWATIVFAFSKWIMMGAIRSYANNYYGGVNDYVSTSDLSNSFSYGLFGGLHTICAISITILWFFIAYKLYEIDHKYKLILLAFTVAYAIINLNSFIYILDNILGSKLIFFLGVIIQNGLLLSFYKSINRKNFRIQIIISLLLFNIMSLFQISIILDPTIGSMQFWYSTLSNGLFIEFILAFVYLSIAKNFDKYLILDKLEEEPIDSNSEEQGINIIELTEEQRIKNIESTQDKKNGEGALTFPNGVVYKGTFKDNQFDGEGILTFPDGVVYKGTFKDGKFDAEGVLTSPNGEVYKWAFKDNTKENIYLKEYLKTTGLKL